MRAADQYPPIGDYAVIGDCHSAALVSRSGSIDWYCVPRFDSGSAFGRLLDWEHGGHCSVSPPSEGWESTREYLDDTLVLATTFQTADGEARLVDCVTSSDKARDTPERELVRILEGLRGAVEFELRIAPRFDYGEVRPWIRRHGLCLHSAVGGNDALVVWCEQELDQEPEHELSARVIVRAGERVRLVLTYRRPEQVAAEEPAQPDPAAIDACVKDTIRWWRGWSREISLSTSDEAAARRSAIALKSLTFAPTGAIVAAATTSLPEVVGGERNFDYRYAWVRDSSFCSRAFAELGAEHEADAFRAFVMRSAAGHAEDLQVLYGVAGERRLGGGPIEWLDGYRRSKPVRVGNEACYQHQLDAYGELVNLTWRWHRRGHSPNDDDWKFLVSLIDHAAEGWRSKDQGIWEWPGEPDHFVHSKVLCWTALDRGLQLAEECMRQAPVARWKRARDELRKTIERRGFDRKRGVYVQAFDRKELDAALLLLPTVEFLAWDDKRMLRTIDAIREELDAGDGLLYRYRRNDGLPGQEGAFLCCSFWLAECLARAGQPADARTVFDQASAYANDLGLFSEQVDPKTGALLGNFPQGLTHLSHISAAVALSEARESL